LTEKKTMTEEGHLKSGNNERGQRGAGKCKSLTGLEVVKDKSGAFWGGTNE